MTPLVLDPVVVAAVAKACEDFLKLQGARTPAIPPGTEPEKPVPAPVESAPAFTLK